MAAFFFVILQEPANSVFRNDGSYYFQGGTLCYKKQNNL